MRTLSLYAALNIQTGEVQGKTTARHTSQDFVGFLGEVVTTCEPAQEIHVILDNLSAHKTQTVAAFLDAHPNVKLHFTPTYSSWLNQVEPLSSPIGSTRTGTRRWSCSTTSKCSITNDAGTRRLARSAQRHLNDAQTKRAWILWKTAKDAVSHRLHTRCRFSMRKEQTPRNDQLNETVH